MHDLRLTFSQRCEEIDHYLRTVRFAEEHRADLVALKGTARRPLDSATLHVLKATVFLHLYNLVESTVTACLHRVADEIERRQCSFDMLSDCWRASWVEAQGKTSESLSPEKRLARVLELCNDVTSRNSISFRPGLPGNIDDSRIEKVAKKFGVLLSISPEILEKVKTPVYNNDGALKLIRLKRNALAHGLDSFSECGRTVAVRDLRRLRVHVVRYLRCVIRCFEQHLSEGAFLSKRSDQTLPDPNR